MFLFRRILFIILIIIIFFILLNDIFGISAYDTAKYSLILTATGSMLTREVDIDFSANWVSLQFYRNEQGRLRFGKIGDMSLFDVETGAQERYFV